MGVDDERSIFSAYAKVRSLVFAICGAAHNGIGAHSWLCSKSDTPHTTPGAGAVIAADMEPHFTVRDLLEQGQDKQALIVLNHIVTAAQAAHDDVRQYILGIRQSTTPDGNTMPVGFIEALDLYLGQVQERYGLTVHLSLPAELATSSLAPEVETQLLRIIQEALTNVRKHAGVNSARLFFTQHPDELQVVIADEGTGFVLEGTQLATRNAPEAHDDTLPHFGLSIMQERTASIGGEVEIRSTPGMGTQVIVHLPRQLKLDEREFGRGLRVLLIDDHPLYLDGLRTMLAARGVQVVGMGRNGLQAQQLAHTLYPDLILMDVEMPVCNGIEATRVIKEELPPTAGNPTLKQFCPR